MALHPPLNGPGMQWPQQSFVLQSGVHISKEIWDVTMLQLSVWDKYVRALMLPAEYACWKAAVVDKLCLLRVPKALAAYT